MGCVAKYTVLIVDDEQLVSDTLAKIFRMAGYDSRAAYSAEAVLGWAIECSPQLAILDVFLPGMNGIELAHWLKQVCPSCQVLLISGQHATCDLIDAEEAAGFCWTTLPKPVHPQNFLAWLPSFWEWVSRDFTSACASLPI